MPGVPEHIINDATELILNHVRRTSQHVERDQPPRFSLDSSRDNALEGIDGEIYAIEETLTSLNARLIQRKKERNGLIPFNQFPQEIASNILWLSIADPWQRKISCSFLQRLHTIASVCSSWRTLVEGTPRFWSVIEFSCPQTTIPHFLRKSGTSPLEIRCFSDGEYNCGPGVDSSGVQRLTATSACLALIIPHSHRVRSLILSSLSTYKISDIFKKPAPLLEELSLSFGHCSFLQPLDLFCGQAGRLKDVTLENIPIRWDSPVLVGLRSLKIKGMPKYSPTMEQVRRLMEANSELEEVGIEDVTVPESFGAEFTQNKKSSPVIMSKMREIQLVNLPFGLVEAVLGSIDSPSIRYFNLQCLFQGLPADRIWSGNLDHIVPLVIEQSKRTELVEITLGKDNVGMKIHIRDRKNSAIRIQFNNTTRPATGIEWLAEKFLRGGGLPAVAELETFQVSLKFGDSFDMGGGAFIHTLDQLRAVKVKSLTIEKGCKHAEELIKYLGEVQENSQWPLPHLMSLTIAGPAGIATHLATTLQRRKHDSPAGDVSSSPKPILMEVLDIENLGGVERKIEKALAKCISSSGTLIRASRSLTYWGGHGDDWEDFDDDNEEEDPHDI